MIYLRPFFGRLAGLTSESVRAEALAAAIVLRNCALSSQTSPAGRRACRTLMRDQALQWRRPTDVSRN